MRNLKIYYYDQQTFFVFDSREIFESEDTIFWPFWVLTSKLHISSGPLIHRAMMGVFLKGLAMLFNNKQWSELFEPTVIIFKIVINLL